MSVPGPGTIAGVSPLPGDDGREAVAVRDERGECS